MSANYTIIPPYSPQTGIPDPLARPDLFDGVLWRRTFAYLIDLCCIGIIAAVLWLVFMILTLLSFGLLGPVLWFGFALIPLAYHTLLVSGQHSATYGMRAFDIQVRSWTGDPPIFLQALAHAAIFYLTVPPTCGLILLVALFNWRKRTLHDALAGLMLVRRPHLPRNIGQGW